ncbi:MAG TPA: class I SAM-dependent methyltransferase, partial [Opitutae bacterium]|nr:class I SAM-dependent methyltransferase [Opitutae bacterium]
PTRYRSSSFDFIYAFSVFTHLTHELQTLWMAEMRRLLKPDGLLLITVHGDHYLNHLSESEKAAFYNGRLVIKRGESVGSNRCAAFHPQKFVADSLAPGTGFKVVDFIREGALGNPKQDAYLFSADA